MIKFYNRNIKGGRVLGVIALLVFFAIRLFFIFFDQNLLSLDIGGGILWGQLKSLIPSVDISILLSGVCGILIALTIAWINNKYAIIRVRTLLPSAFVLLLLSIDPHFVVMSPHYIAAIFFMLSVDALFASYQDEKGQRWGIDVGIYLSLASLFVTEYLLLIPLFVIGFSMMRSLSFKMFFALLLPLILVYFLVYSICFSLGSLDLFYAQFDFELLDNIYVLSSSSSISTHLLAVFGILFLVVLAIDNRLNNYKDKTRVRDCVAFAHLTLMFLFIVYCLSPIQAISMSVLIPLLITMAFVLARFWETATDSWKIYSFFVMLLLYIYFMFHNIVTFFS